MAANVTFNPVVTTNAAGSFNTQSAGYLQGTALNDPAIRNELAGGILLSTETISMWGGVGIYENVPGLSTQPASVLGGQVGRATALTGSKALTGFSVFDQAHAMINTPQSPVPLAAVGMSVNFYRLGSGARIAVACDANLATLEGELITTSVSWDFTNQQLVEYSAPTFSSGAYTSGSGLVALTTSAPHGLLPGDVIVVSGAAGSGSFASINGTWVLGAGTTGSTLNYTIATGLTLTISGATIATGGILPVKVLDVNIGNSMTVSYDSVTGYATWNRSGNCAIILI